MFSPKVKCVSCASSAAIVAGVAVGDLHLRRERIGLDVDAPPALQMLLADLLRAGHVEERVGLAVERAGSASSVMP